MSVNEKIWEADRIARCTIWIEPNSGGYQIKEFLMSLKFIAANLLTLLFFLGLGEAGEGLKKRAGSLTGTLQSQKKSPNGKNIIIEVLAPGEEKARPYRVQYDPKVKGPIPSVLEAVRAAQVGDVVMFDWVDTGEGLAITSFQILKKGGGNKK